MTTELLSERTPPRTHPVSAAEPVPLSSSEVAAVLRRRWRTLVAVLVVVGVVAAGILLSLRNYYASSVGMVPEAKSLPSGLGQLGGLAVLAGLNLGSAGAGQSPQFYAAVLQSRPLLYAVVQRRYPTATLARPMDADSATLIEIFGRHDRNLRDYLIPARNEAEQLERAARKLAKRTKVGVDLKSGIVHLTVRYWSRDLAAGVANAYADELVRFNAETRQTQARARRVFLDRRVAEAERELGAAEGAVRAFMERNRTYEDSPALRFQLTSLQRALTVRQELYLDLRRQLDAARVSEVDDVPALSIIERAVPSQRKSDPNRTLYLLVILTLTALLSGAYLVVREHRDRLFPRRPSGAGDLQDGWPGDGR